MKGKKVMMKGKKVMMKKSRMIKNRVINACNEMRDEGRNVANEGNEGDEGSGEGMQ